MEYYIMLENIIQSREGGMGLGLLWAAVPIPVPLFQYLYYFFSSIFCSEDGGNRFLKNIGTCIPKYMMSSQMTLFLTRKQAPSCYLNHGRFFWNHQYRKMRCWNIQCVHKVPSGF
jgi:hypothetical protein